MSENVLLYAPPVKLDVPSEIPCTVETAISTTAIITTQTIATTNSYTLAAKTSKDVTFNPRSIRFKKSGRFLIGISDGRAYGERAGVKRCIKAYFNEEENILFSSTGEVANAAINWSKFMTVKEDDVIFVGLYDGTTSNGTNVYANTVKLDNSGKSSSNTIGYKLNFSLGRQIAKITDGILMVENEEIADINEYIEVIEITT